MQAVDVCSGEPELPENLLVVFSDPRAALCGYLGHAMNLDRTADRRSQFAAGTVERDDDVVRQELGIVDHLLGSTHRPERDVRAIEDLVPVSHRLGAEDF